MSVYYIGMDVHCKFTVIAVQRAGKIVQRFKVPTTVQSIRQTLGTISGGKYVALEEGPMAGWLYRNLRDYVDRITVSDPRRNKLIASDGQKDDKIDAEKLAALLRGGYLKPVHHSKDQLHVELKRWAGIYHDRVREATRCINKIRAQARMEGVRITRRVILDPAHRKRVLKELSNKMFSERIELLCIGYDSVSYQARLSRNRFVRLSRRNSIVRKWSELPGIGDIRAATLLAYLETPWRFSRKNRLWKYCGVGLVYNGSAGVGRLRVPWAVNKKLKNVVMGAALTAVRSKSNEYRSYYERMLKAGVLAGNARRSVARKLLTVMWGMWKQQSKNIFKRSDVQLSKNIF